MLQPDCAHLSHVKQKPHRHFKLDQIIPFPWHIFFSSRLLYCSTTIPTFWMTDHAHTSHAISWVFTAQILSELKLIWHILQTDLVFIQQTIAHKGRPQKTGPLILIGGKRSNFFVITLACIGCSLSLCRTQPILTSHIDTFIFVGARSMELPEGNRQKKKKNVNSTLVFFLPQTPLGNFTDSRTLKRLLGGKDQCCVWSCIIVLSTIIYNPPMKRQICLLGGSKFEKLSWFVWQPDFPAF